MATVGQLMSTNLSVIAEDTTVKQAAGRMLSQHIGSLLVKKGEDFSGIITETDVVRAVAEADDVAGISVVHVMSSPILTIEKKTFASLRQRPHGEQTDPSPGRDRGGKDRRHSFGARPAGLL